MSIWFAALLGLVQGVAEFLPISSSGHLCLFQTFFHMENVEETQMLFDVMLHLGTLVAVCIYYWKDVVDVVTELWGLLMGKKRKTQPNVPVQKLIVLAIIASVPLVLAILVDDYVEILYSNTLFIGVALLATGGLLYISDRVTPGTKNEETATWKDALVIGLVQLVAVLPGISRSGSTITASALRGCNRDFAVRFSFLLSIPAIVGANILQVGDAISSGMDQSMLLPCLVGTVVAGVSGYFAICLVKMLADKGKFGRFAYYCWAAGIATVIATIVL